jgi:hypothetical protein
MSTFTIETDNRSVTYAAKKIVSIEMTTSGSGARSNPKRATLQVRHNNGDIDLFCFKENVEAAEQALAAAKEAMEKA